jgi:hypothetical protein
MFEREEREIAEAKETLAEIKQRSATSPVEAVMLVPDREAAENTIREAEDRIERGKGGKRAA